jgi:hypothetical protein
MCVIQNIKNITCTLTPEFENSAFTAITVSLSEGWILLCYELLHMHFLVVYTIEITVFMLWITMINTQNVSVTKIVDFSSLQCAESKYGLRSQFLALVVMIHEVWLKA